jgi:MFS family permease
MPAPADHRFDPAGNPVDRFGLSRPVWQLGWVSLFTDLASEMIYPLLPLFLTVTLGAGAMSIGVIEGVAEAANSILKIVSGWFADRWRTPKLLVLGGYGLSSIARPFIAIATAWPQVLLIRFTDRLGKGIRTSPRDAMLARFARAESRGRVYGFHRAMDHAGAVVGPLVASAFLYFRHDDYRTLFALTIVPGVIVVLIIAALPADEGHAASGRKDSMAVGRAGGPLPRRFHLAVAVIFIFSLGNASDAFLLLQLSDVGVARVWIPLLWSALHVVKASSSFVGGALSDRFGRRTLIVAGYVWYAAVYAALGVLQARGAVVAVFLAYGLYFGLTEGVEKAWVADLAPADRRGTAFGIYNAALGFGALAASLLFGEIWTRASPTAAFLTGAALALGASVLLIVLLDDRDDGVREGR